MSETLKTLVIGTSLTALSDSIVRTGVAIARRTGASPWLLHSHVPPMGLPEHEVTESSGLGLQTQTLLDGLTNQALRTGLAGLRGFHPSQIHLAFGSPPREIASLARKVKAGLILVGANEGGPLRQLLLGSTADALIRKAPCPVLVLRSEAAFGRFLQEGRLEPALLQVRTGHPRKAILGSAALRGMHEAECNLLVMPPEAHLWSQDDEPEDADPENVFDEVSISAFRC